MTFPLRRAGFATETRFLLDTIAAALDQRMPGPEPGLDWSVFFAALRHHLVIPLVGSTLASPGAVAMPDQVRRDLTALRHQVMATNFALSAELVRLFRLFADQGLEVLALKGPALAVLLHGDPFRRCCRDIDLLVPQGTEPAVRALLAGEGYGRTADTVRMERNAVGLYHPNRPFPIELHTRMADADGLFPLARLRPFETAVDVEIAGTRIRTLNLEVALAYAAFHGANHHWSRLLWLADIAVAAQHPGIDWAVVAALAERTGTRRHLALAGRLSGALLGRSLPGLPVLSRRDRVAIGRIEAMMPAMLALPPPDTDLVTIRKIGLFRVLWADILLHQRLGARLALLTLRTHPNDDDRAVVALPERLRSLYYGVRFGRVLWRLLKTLSRVGRRRSPRTLATHHHKNGARQDMDVQP